ncbi:hypothetical protein BpHYR1_018457 [Brachionus plicatilis]|uniref:Ubiquitin-like protease family profile domain-containing protein n=1 Tax=Brachionus plicatilis TaxID=10195 RepID=A0A3M7SGE7_BRAPC|nr:hypothetical protein BpHYR1_018457 [Brachionus plicatilis]
MATFPISILQCLIADQCQKSTVSKIFQSYLNSSHWILQSKIYYFASNSRIPKYKQCNGVDLTSHWQFLKDFNNPQQKNTYDCGVFLCKIAHKSRQV